MIDVNKYKDYYFQTAKKIFSVPSPTGYYTEIANVIEEFAKENGAEFSRSIALPTAFRMFWEPEDGQAEK